MSSAQMDALQGMLALTAEIKAEIEERCPEYFDYHAIRIRGNAGSKILEAIGGALGTDIQLCPPESAVNAVDALFEDALRPYFQELDREDRNWLLPAESICPRADRPISDLLSARSVGSDLVYYVGGVGPELIIVNALSSKLDYWRRLIPLLTGVCRVIIWQLREDPAASLMNHVVDLEAIVREEELQCFDLLGWCTGPKIAMEYWRRNEGTVRSLIFLNGALKASTRADEDETEYERNLEILCRAVADNPDLAGVMMKALQRIEGPDPSSPIEVLAASNTKLREAILFPFRNLAATTIYVRQMLDFLMHDVRGLAPRVDVPMLWIGCEYDRIASSQVGRRDARLFPRGEYVEIKSATHYCLFDRPKAVAEPIIRFLEAAPRDCPAAAVA